ncbi:MAG: divergent polysaccharide deacetylase family protein [Rhodospirillaceae bacterium]
MGQLAASVISGLFVVAVGILIGLLMSEKFTPLAIRNHAAPDVVSPLVGSPLVGSPPADSPLVGSPLVGSLIIKSPEDIEEESVSDTVTGHDEPGPPEPPPLPEPLPGPLPRPPLSDRPPWLRNAVSFTLPATRPMIALVFDDLGVDRKRTERVIRLPGPLTLSFLPYAADLPRQTKAAHAAGHELMVHMPMEPLAANLDPGPGALLTRLPADEIQRRLENALAAFDGYVGINNHMGSRFTSSRDLLTPVLAELRRRGLLFLDSVTTTETVGMAVAASLNLPHTRRNVFLDDVLTTAAVHASLIRLEQIAFHTGLVVAIGHPHDVTLEAVASWLPGLAAKGLVLAPISAIVRVHGYSGDRADPEPGIIQKGQSHG